MPKASKTASQRVCGSFVGFLLRLCRWLRMSWGNSCSLDQLSFLDVLPPLACSPCDWPRQGLLMPKVAPDWYAGTRRLTEFPEAAAESLLLMGFVTLEVPDLEASVGHSVPAWLVFGFFGLFV